MGLLLLREGGGGVVMLRSNPQCVKDVEVLGIQSYEKLNIDIVLGLKICIYFWKNVDVPGVLKYTEQKKSF